MRYKPNPKLGIQRQFCSAQHPVPLMEYARAHRGDAEFDPDESVFTLQLEGVFYYLNLSAGIVFAALGNGETDDDAVDNLLEVFNVDRSRAELDVSAAVSKLSEKNLLVECQ